MITYDDDDGNRFNFRVAGLALSDGKVLVHREVGEPFWTLPGGRVEMGETTIAALVREIREELTTEAQVERLLWVVENFFRFDEKNYHEIGAYYLIKLPAPLPGSLDGQTFPGCEQSTQLDFRWVDVDSRQLAELPIRPSFLSASICRLPESPVHVVHYD